jgi:hypothetical protein
MSDVLRIVPPGIRFNFLAVAFHKYMLEHVAMPPQERLDVLEALDSYASGDYAFSKRVMAVIKPLTAETVKMMSHALDLPPKHRRESDGYRVLTTEPAWSHLIEVNPSLENAIDLWCTPIIRQAA